MISRPISAAGTRLHTKSPSSNRILTILGLGLCLSLLGDSTLYAVLPNPGIAARAGLTTAMVGVVLGLNRLVRILTNFPAGWLLDRMPRRGLMTAAAGLGAISTMCYAAGQGTGLFLLGRILWGLAWSGIWVGCNTMALDLAAASNRGALTGRLNMWFYLGIALSSFAGGLFTDLFSFRGGLWISAGLGGLGFLVWLVFLPETRHFKKSQEEPLPGGPMAATAVDNPSEISALEVLHPAAGEVEKTKNQFQLGRTIETAAALFIQRLVFNGVLSATAILWLAEHFGEGVQVGSLAVPLATLSGSFASLRVLASLAAAPATGSLADRARSRWSVLAGLLAVGALGLWAMGRTQTGTALLGALLISISAGGIPGLTAALIGDQASETRHSRSLGVAFSAGDLGSAIGPAIGLGLAPGMGLGGVYLACAGVYLLAGAWALAKSRKFMH